MEDEYILHDGAIKHFRPILTVLRLPSVNTALPRGTAPPEEAIYWLRESCKRNPQRRVPRRQSDFRSKFITGWPDLTWRISSVCSL